MFLFYPVEFVLPRIVLGISEPLLDHYYQCQLVAVFGLHTVKARSLSQCWRNVVGIILALPCHRCWHLSSPVVMSAHPALVLSRIGSLILCCEIVIFSFSNIQ